MLSGKLRRKTMHCFADDLDVIDNPGLDKLVLIERSAPAGSVLLDAANGFQNIL